ncbi:MAG: hypothetical protein JKY37_27615 [Nannocystaceae bacterium]|nr:hypothetical protein [Nannocystaceae bacterium]
MRLSITIDTVVCHATTFEASADEPYFALFVNQNKGVKDNKPQSALVGQYVSPVKRGIRRDDWWRPQKTIEMDLEDGIENFTVTMAMYEMDNAVLYNKLKTATEPLIPSAPKWEDVKLPGLTDIADSGAWLKAVVSLLKVLRESFQHDDLLAIEPRGFSADGPKEFMRAVTFVGRPIGGGHLPAGGRYTVQLSFKLMD